MSWTDIFPLLDEEMMDAYRAGVTEEEKGEFEEWFGVKGKEGGRFVHARAGETPALLATS